MRKMYGFGAFGAFGLRAAAALMVVAGVWGTVAAQGHVVTANPDAEVVNTADKMRASVTIENTAYLEGKSAEPSGEKLKFADIGARVNNVVDGTRTGNLGVIRVRTNASSWDIEMSTKNGGRLLKDGRTTTEKLPPVCKTEVPFPGSGCLEYYPDEYKKESGYTLLYSNGTTGTAGEPNSTDGGRIVGVGEEAGRDTVLLQVAIGIAASNNGGDVGGSFGDVYVKGATAAGSTFYPTVIDPNNVMNSNKANKAISFAKAFAADYQIGGGTNTNAAANATVGGVNLKTVDATFGVSKGFGSTTATETDKTKQWEYFYINAGISEDNYDKIVGSKSGEYYEVFTFDLVTNLE